VTLFVFVLRMVLSVNSLVSIVVLNLFK
jgi:hypothetical protein